jgi:death on curing protein
MSSPSEFNWIYEDIVLAIHSEQVSIHGGLSGVRDQALLESALAKPKNLKFYKDATLIECAASYIFGLVSNHPFLDGNKRTGFVTGITFLLINGHYITATETEVVIIITKLASGQMSEDELTDWLQTVAISK